MGDLVIVVDSDEVTKITKTLLEPMVGVRKIVITMFRYKKPAKWMKGSI